MLKDKLYQGRLKTAFHLAVIVLACIVCYSNSLDVPYQFDDNGYIADNMAIRDVAYFTEPSRVEEAIFNLDIRQNFRARYVGYLSFFLNYKLGGLDVTGYHIVNLAVHVFNALLVYGILLLALGTPRIKATGLGKNAKSISLLSALLFAVHPLQTEAITYITQRFASLEAFFYLLSLFLYAKWRTETHEAGAFDKRGWYLYLGCLASAVMAMKTKETAFTLPLMVILYEYMFLKGNVKRRLFYLLPMALCMLIVPLSVIDTEMPIGEAVDKATRTQVDFTRDTYLFTQFRVLVTYIRLLLLPVNQNLDYDYPLYDTFFAPPVFISSLFLALIASSIGYLMLRFRRGGGAWMGLVAFGGLWFFVALSVESSLIALEDVIFEHRLYLPSIGVFAALSAGLFSLYGSLRGIASKTALMAVVVLITILLSTATYTRNTVWGSETSLWEDVVEKSPDKARGHNNLGVNYKRSARYEEAIECYTRALEIDPNFVDAFINKGNVHLSTKQYKMAINDFSRAIELNPYSAEAYNNRGVAYGDLKQYRKALDDYDAAIRLNPNYMTVFNNRGSAYMNLNQLEQAVEDYSRAIALDPNFTIAYDNRGFVYMTKLDEKAKGCEDWKIACNLGICNNYRLALNKGICK